jgi:hypothetical protein
MSEFALAGATSSANMSASARVASSKFAVIASRSPITRGTVRNIQHRLVLENQFTPQLQCITVNYSHCSMIVRTLGVIKQLNQNDSLFRKVSSFHSDWGTQI